MRCSHARVSSWAFLGVCPEFLDQFTKFLTQFVMAFLRSAFGSALLLFIPVEAPRLDFEKPCLSLNQLFVDDPRRGISDFLVEEVLIHGSA